MAVKLQREVDAEASFNYSEQPPAVPSQRVHVPEGNSLATYHAEPN